MNGNDLHNVDFLLMTKDVESTDNGKGSNVYDVKLSFINAKIVISPEMKTKDF